MNITRIVMAVLCVGGVSFLLGVLRALVRERKSVSSRAVKVYFAKFIPSKKRGELIVMDLETGGRRLPIKVGKRIALIAVIATSLALPLHSQQSNSNVPSDAGTAASPQASAGNQQVSQEVLQELDAMKKRIEQLENQLKQQQAAEQPNTVVENSKMTAPVPSASKENPPGEVSAALPQTGAAAEKQEKPAPFSFADFTWLNGNPRIKDVPLDTKFFTPEIRSDMDYIVDFNHPADDTIGGSSEVFRANEFQLTQLGVGGDFHYDNVQARVMTQFGMYSATTPRNDASPAHGNWDLDTAYRYISEAYGGYHLNVLDGINIQGGIFMSYVGLFSYYNFDNWAYQPSYVSSNTPWFFNGMRVQIFPNEHLKIEPWLINGWQSYGRFNHRPGVGAQILWRPNSKFEALGNQYLLGADTLNTPGRIRYHTDDSIQYKYYDDPGRFLDKAAFSLTGDIGCEHGGGVSCDTDSVHVISGQRAIWPKQDFLGFMVYNRLWFHKDLYGFTLGGGRINNPGRYLVLLPPINGATAITGSPYFTENPGDPFKAWDASATFDYMPKQYITFRTEFDHRAANVPYFTGRGGITPPGGNTGAPGSAVPGWSPDLVRDENRMDLAILVMF
jgi:hypothetical protein